MRKKENSPCDVYDEVYLEDEEIAINRMRQSNLEEYLRRIQELSGGSEGSD